MTKIKKLEVEIGRLETELEIERKKESRKLRKNVGGECKKLECMLTELLRDVSATGNTKFKKEDFVKIKQLTIEYTVITYQMFRDVGYNREEALDMAFFVLVQYILILN